MKKGKGVCVKKKAVKQGGEKSRDRACVKTKEGKNVGGWTHIKRGSFGQKIILVLFLEALTICMEVY